MRSTFFSSIAHELRTPLNSIIPIIRMILERYIEKTNPSNERLKVLMNVVLNSSLHL
jgi:signal transduction histidine kinase